MKKYISYSIALTAFLFLINNSGFAQRDGKTKFGIGPTIGWATSNPLKDVPGNKGWGLGVGGMIQVEHFFTNNASGVAEAGVISYGGRSAGSTTKNKAYTAIPVRVGGNLYVSNLHVGAKIGVGLNSLAGKSVTSFAYSPQIGYSFSRNNFPLDFTVEYDGYAGHESFSALMLRLSLIL